jgi:hypothetical protein
MLLQAQKRQEADADVANLSGSTASTVPTMRDAQGARWSALAGSQHGSRRGTAESGE